MPTRLEAIFDRYVAITKEIPGFTPSTSTKFKRDLIAFFDGLDLRREHGAIIEVGTFIGSTSCLLAMVAEEYELPLILIDISDEFMKKTLNNIAMCTGYKGITAFKGSYSEFVERVKLVETPLFVFIDADHTQAAVEKDLRAMLAMNPLPRYSALHDYNLRSTGKGRETIGVDRALAAVVGDCPKTMIGAQFESGLPKNHAGDFYDAGGSEGALIDLSKIDMNKPISAPAIKPMAIDAVGDFRSAAIAKILPQMRPFNTSLMIKSSPEQILGEFFDALQKVHPKGPTDFFRHACRVSGPADLSAKYFKEDWNELRDIMQSVEKENDSISLLDWPYFKDLGSLYEGIGDANRSTIYSVSKDMKEGSILYEPSFMMLGTPIYRAAVVNQKIQAARKAAYRHYIEDNALDLAKASLARAKEAIAEFERDGIIIRESWYGKTFKQILDGVAVIEPELMAKITKYEGETAIYRTQLFERHKEIFPNIYSKEFLAVWGTLTGAIDKPHNLFIEVLLHGKNESDGNKIIHVDTFHTTMKWWSTIRDVDVDEGPFNYWPGTHKWSGRKVFWYYARVIAQRFAGQPEINGSLRVSETDMQYLLGDGDAQPLECNTGAGTLIVADTSGLHRRGHAEPGKRRDLFFGWSRYLPDFA